MERIRGFDPIAAPGAHTLILGSMPSLKSLHEGRYYAHPRNAFWPIMRGLLALPDQGYDALTRALARHGYAVWDVLRSCRRPGSLDADIDPASVVANDFGGFLDRQPGVDRVFFNGATAERLFRRHVLPGLRGTHPDLELRRLPSTSPANASLSLEQKLAAWRIILPDGAGGKHGSTLAFDRKSLQL